MKRLLFLIGIAGLMAFTMSQADLSQKFTTVTVTDSLDPTSHTSIVGDTSIDSLRLDSGYTHEMYVHDYERIEFYMRVVFDSNWTDDTIFGILETSVNKGGERHWVVFDTIFKFHATDSGYAATSLRLDTLAMCVDRVRFNLLYHDWNEITMPGWVNNTYDYTCDVWLKGW